MTDPASPLSYTVKAGRLMSLLGWITLLLNLGILAFAAGPLVALGARPMLFALLLAFLIGIVALYLVVAAGLKRHRPWARVGGVVLSAVSLLLAPIGTIFGAFILFYLYQGWHEHPSVA